MVEILHLFLRELVAGTGRASGSTLCRRLREWRDIALLPQVFNQKRQLVTITPGVIRGGFVSIDEGSRARWMLIGFGVGAAELTILVETYQVTAAGQVPLGSGQVETAGGRILGILVPCHAAKRFLDHIFLYCMHLRYSWVTCRKEVDQSG